MSETQRMLDGKVVVITGAGRGIGREIALLAARHGASVLVNDLGCALDGDDADSAPAAEVASVITAAGGNALADSSSVAEFDSARAIIARAGDAFGSVDCVINGAGILRDAIFHKMPVEDWRAVLDVHLHGSFNMCRAAAPLFREQQRGSFVHMTSTSGLIGNLGQANYAAAKMGIVGLSKSIALDMARYGVRSNCVAPFASSRMIGSLPSDTPAQRARRAALQQLRPEQIAPLVVFLASDAARGVSGQVFAARGNEVILMSQPRPLRSMHHDGGWTPQLLAQRMLPAFEGDFYRLDVTSDVFGYDPI